MYSDKDFFFALCFTPGARLLPVLGPRLWRLRSNTWHDALLVSSRASSDQVPVARGVCPMLIRDVQRTPRHRLGEFGGYFVCAIQNPNYQNLFLFEWFRDLNVRYSDPDCFSFVLKRNTNTNVNCTCMQCMSAFWIEQISLIPGLFNRMSIVFRC